MLPGTGGIFGGVTAPSLAEKGKDYSHWNELDFSQVLFSIVDNTEGSLRFVAGGHQGPAPRDMGGQVLKGATSQYFESFL